MMAPTRWRLRWFHIVLAVIVLLALFGAHPTSRDLSREYMDRVVATWGWKHSNGDDSTPPASPHDENQLVELGFKGEELPVDELEHPSSTSPDGQDGASHVDQAPPAASTSQSMYTDIRLVFQNDIEFIQHAHWFDHSLTQHKPHNYRGPGHETFATFFASRNASMMDPYFVACQQIVYRLLWDERSRSHTHPVTVFVAPFVSQEQRDYFLAAGAIVRELDLVPFLPDPNHTGAQLANRLVDVLSKLLMWNQTDFSRIAYLDSDAFPRKNIDHIFSEDISPAQTCNTSRLAPEDRHLHSTSDTCNYVFSGVVEWSNMINAGVLVFKPDTHLTDMLLRDSKHQEEYDNGFIEQAFLSHFYRPDGPFPYSNFSESWNSPPKNIIDGMDVEIVHGKLWIQIFEPNLFLFTDFNSTWDEMLDLYASPRFAQLRMQDDL